MMFELKSIINTSAMKTILKIVLPLYILTVLITSCDNREDAWAGRTPDYSFKIKRQNEDSVINREKSKFIDSVKINFPVTYHYTTSYNNKTIVSLNKNNSSASVVITDSTITYTAKAEGYNTIFLKLTDPFKHDTIDTLMFFHYVNLPPVAVATVKQELLSSKKMIIDLTQSYDRDAKYGGYIKQWYYKVIGTSINAWTLEPKYQQYMSESRIYTCIVKVLDNENDTSVADTILFELK